MELFIKNIARYNYNIRINLSNSYTKQIYLHKDVFGIEIPFEFEGVIGKITFPNILLDSDFDPKKRFKDIYYSDDNKHIVGSFLSSNLFYIDHLRCYITSLDKLDKTFITKLNSRIDLVSQIIENYKFGIFRVRKTLNSITPRVDCDMIDQHSLERYYATKCVSDEITLINQGFSKRMLTTILGYSKKEFEFEFKHTLLIEARDHLDLKKYRHCIINCCTIVEILMSEQITLKLTKNGAKEGDVEIILKSISGIDALVKVAKNLGVNFPNNFNSPRGFDYQKLAHN